MRALTVSAALLVLALAALLYVSTSMRAQKRFGALFAWSTAGVLGLAVGAMAFATTRPVHPA